jgi:uncharacterized protein (TIGR00369 family)
MQHLGFEITKIEVGRIEGELTLEQKHRQHNSFAHGGIIAILTDMMVSFAAVSVPEHQHVVTSELKVSSFRWSVRIKLLAKGCVLKQGSKPNFYEAEVSVLQRDKGPKLRAKATAILAIITPAAIKRSV